MMSAISWIRQQTVMCSILIVYNRTDVSEIVIEPSLMSSLQSAKRRLEGILFG